MYRLVVSGVEDGVPHTYEACTVTEIVEAFRQAIDGWDGDCPRVVSVEGSRAPFQVEVDLDRKHVPAMFADNRADDLAAQLEARLRFERSHRLP